IGILLIIYSLVNFSINQIWDWASTVSIIVGLVAAGIGVYYVMRFRKKELSKRTMVYGGNVVLSSVAFLAIFVLLALFTTRHHVRKDLTSGGLFSLADQTKTVLKKLDKDVTLYAFYKEDEQTFAKDLLDEYAFRSPKLTYEFIDPIKKPQIARQYQVTQYNTVVVVSGAKRETVTDLNENNLTNAIMKVTRDLDKVIYFTTGHGENDINDDKPQGYKEYMDGIKKENYLVRTINIAQEKKIPQDCSVLVISGPRADFFQFELDTIGAYIDRGGKLMVMLDPEWKPALVEFLKKYKIGVDDVIVVDATGLGQLFGMGPEVPLVSKYEDHEIFKKFNTMTFFPMACSVRPLDEGDTKVTTKVLFRSTTKSWGEKDYHITNVRYDDGVDIKGPVPLAVVATKNIGGDKKAQILVIGDSDFARNGYIKNSGNYDLALNMINWLAEEEDMITIRPKRPDDRRLTLTQKQNKIIMYLTVIAMPLLIIIAGGFVYFRRR
ncbi:MAG: GldG family protein, partial [Calditrichia bacterium]